MDPELDWIQTYLAERGPAARGHRYPNEFRLRTARWAKRQRDLGQTQAAIEHDVGIPWRTLKRWVAKLKHIEDKPTSLVPVRLEKVLLRDPDEFVEEFARWELEFTDEVRASMLEAFERVKEIEEVGIKEI